MATKIEVRKSYRSAEAKVTTDLTAKSKDVKTSLYSKSVFLGSLLGETRAKFVEYCESLAKAEPDFAAKWQEANKEGLTVQNIEDKLMPICMYENGKWYLLDIPTVDEVIGQKKDGSDKTRKKKVERAGYIAPRYIDSKGTIDPEWEENAQYEYDLLKELKDGMWNWDNFRKLMEQGWRFRGLAPNAKQYSLTDKWVSEYESKWAEDADAETDTAAETEAVSRIPVLTYDALKEIAKTPKTKKEDVLAMAAGMTKRQQSTIASVWTKSHKA